MRDRKSGGKVDCALKFLKEVLQCEELHYGLWDEDDDVNLDGYKRAQARYTYHLLDAIPEDVKTVLDVGCGLGLTTQLMRQRGIDAEGLAPDAYLQQEFRKRLGPDVKFHMSTFEEFDPGGRQYDLILMSESVQYVEHDLLFPAATNATHPGSYLLASDFYHRHAFDEKYYATTWVESEFLARAADNGFEKIWHNDVTERILPTFALAQKYYDRFCIPSVNLLVEFFRLEQPILSRIGALALSRPIGKLRRFVYEVIPQNLDREKFRREMTYKMFLFKRTGG